MEPLMDRAREGALNLVNHCAEVKLGERVALVHEQDRGDETLAGLIKQVVEEQGAACEVLWLERTDQGLAPTAEQLATLQSSDKVIATTRDSSLFRPLIHASRPSLVASNWFETCELMATEHARYHWGMARAFFTRIEELFTVGSRWTITTPKGTHLSGVIGDFSTRASYREDERQPAQIRTLHSPIYTPVASLEAEGQIVAEFTGGFKRIPCEDPAVMVIENNRMVDFTGGPGAKPWIEQYRARLADTAQRFGESASIVDSWHGGTHPKAEFMQDLLGNGCTAVMHFHLGRTTGKTGDYLSAEISHHTLEVDGRRIYKGGKIMIWDDPKIEAAAEQYGLSDWR